MNNLQLNNLTITMSSLELVDFINSQRKEDEAELRHSHFLEKVIKVLGAEESQKFGSHYLSIQNKELPCYKFPKREACLMAMSYSYELQAKVFDRMTELENASKPQFKLPANYLEALKELVVKEETIINQNNLLLEQKPKVDFYEQVTSSKDAVDIGTAAKVLNIKNIGRAKLFEFLRKNKILDKNNQPYQKYIDSGWLRLIESKWQDKHGNNHIYCQTVVYQKGIDAIRKLILQMQNIAIHQDNQEFNQELLAS